MTVDFNLKKAQELRGSTALYATGALPAFLPGLRIYNNDVEDGHDDVSSSMENLKSSFEEWRSLKEDDTSFDPATPLPLEIFEGSLYDVIGSLDQEVFQKNAMSLKEEQTSSTILHSPPCSLSERILMLLDRLQYQVALKPHHHHHHLSPVFRDQVTFWKNAISVWLFDSLLSPSWKEFLSRIEDALSSSVVSFFGLKGSFEKQDALQGVNNDEVLKTAPPAKSRFEYVSSNAAPINMPSISTKFDDEKSKLTKPTVLPNGPSVSNIFKDFAQPSISSSNASLSSLLTAETGKTINFFENSDNLRNIPKPTCSPRYATPDVPKNQSIDPDWYLKWTKNASTASLSSSIPSSGIEKLESLTSEKDKKLTSNSKENLAKSLGFETIE
ncbi:hypothetical protein DI09_129p10 [Mitosporidium daphniae]|uniref:Uncharacterized protein n=1 Tax=Mitosporidium daphniae TaxID=1485682 RepID=A0A098VUX8_9MICR|nr:uncharacterized protein DI09_129p10 [Mitosporidium daphniae]KGG52878.1 hypothetical protein DI09_129p10 [Mitosporidium daphniae]|eukprot:XP_013239314.1 uncharacterized protein DI09_129p10 [Mitosporidium daphniae]